MYAGKVFSLITNMASCDVDSENNSIDTDFCHITGKFCTESELIEPKQYFSDYNNDLEEFLKQTKDIYNKQHLGVETRLLSYPGEPTRFLFDPNKHTKEYIKDWKKANKGLKLNEELASVKTRKSLTAMKQVVPKYSLYQFNAINNETIHPAKANIFEIKFYKPFMSKGRKEDVKIQQEILIRGNQSLKQLQSAIVCHLDYCGLQDVSNLNPSMWHNKLPRSKETSVEFPSCFFFINKTFYTLGSDLSECVREFLKRQRIGTCASTNMDVLLDDIPVQVGRPYVYQHLGQCEHVFVISDIRLRCPEDPAKVYPFVTAVSNSQGKQCMLCGTTYAHWLVANFAKLTLSRAFLCQRCFLSYCYVDNRKAGDFQAYQYFDPVTFL